MSQNGKYLSKNVKYLSQNGKYLSKNVKYLSQNGKYLSQNGKNLSQHGKYLVSILPYSAFKKPWFEPPPPLRI